MALIHVDSVSKNDPRRVGLRTELRRSVEDVSFTSTRIAVMERVRLVEI